MRATSPNSPPVSTAASCLWSPISRTTAPGLAGRSPSERPGFPLAHSGFVDQEHVAGADLGRQRRRRSARLIGVQSAPGEGQRVDGVAVHADLLRQHTLAAAAGGAKPITAWPVSRHASATTAIAADLPLPAGPTPAATSAGVDHMPGQGGLPLVERPAHKSAAERIAG